MRIVITGATGFIARALGDLVAGARVARDVDAIFRHRAETIARLFPGRCADADQESVRSRAA